jgi:hypothetical protein
MAIPSILTHPSNQQVISGGTLNLSVDATGTPPLYYQWRRDTTNVGTDSSVFQATNFSDSSRGLYDVAVSNADGTTISNDATVTMLPNITTQPASSFILNGADYTLSVVATGFSPITYQWKKDTTNVTDATDSTCVIRNFSSDSSRGIYRVGVTCDGNTVYSNDATVYSQPAITSSPDKTATEGTAYSYAPTKTGRVNYWGLTGAPTGMTFDSTTGVIGWTPSYDRTNSGSLRLTANGDTTATQDWTVAVNFVTPSITNSPRTDATEHVGYSYTPTATVIDFWKYDLTGAPTGMTVSSTTGKVDWTPSYDRTNSGSLTLTLRSLNGLTDHKDWTIAVTMIAPVITSTPSKTATEGSLYTYTPTLTAQDFWKYDLTGAPTGMTLNSTTGAVRWTPNYDQSNSGSLRLRAYDLNGLNTYQDWTVASPYIQPVITSTPDTTAYTETLYSYTPHGTIVHKDVWSLSGAPSGMTFDPTSGAITWIPDADQTSSGQLILSYKSLNGLKGDQTFTLTVFPEPPSQSISGGGQKMISPYGLSYTVKQVWVLESNTNMPIGVRDEYTF